MYHHVGGKRFLDLKQMAHFDYWGGDECHLLRTDQNPVPTCKMIVKNVVVLFFALYRVFKSMEPLSFDSPTLCTLELDLSSFPNRWRLPSSRMINCAICFKIKNRFPPTCYA